MADSILGLGGLGGILGGGAGGGFTPTDLPNWFDGWIANPSLCRSRAALALSTDGADWFGYTAGNTPASLVFSANQAFTYGMVWYSGTASAGAPLGIFNNGNSNAGDVGTSLALERGGSGQPGFLLPVVVSGSLNQAAISPGIDGIVENRSYLVVMTRPAGGEMTVYVRALDGSYAATGGTSILAAEGTNAIVGQPFWVGRSGARAAGPFQSLQNIFYSTRAFSASEVDTLFSGGAAYTYQSMQADGLLGNMVSFWNLGERTGDAADLHGPNDLPRQGAPGQINGEVLRQASDRMAVSDWSSAGGLVAANVNPNLEPTYIAAGLNGQPVVRFENLQHLVFNPGAATYDQPQPNTLYTLAVPANTIQSAVAGGQNSGVRNDVFISALGDWTQFAGSGFADSGVAVVAAVPIRIASIFDGAASQMILDNTTMGAVVSPGTDPLRPIVLGAQNGGSQHFTGDIALHGIQNARASAQDLADMDAWIVARYGL